MSRETRKVAKKRHDKPANWPKDAVRDITPFCKKLGFPHTVLVSGGVWENYVKIHDDCPEVDRLNQVKQLLLAFSEECERSNSNKVRFRLADADKARSPVLSFEGAYMPVGHGRRVIVLRLSIEK